MAEPKLMTGVTGQLVQMWYHTPGKNSLTSTTAEACRALWCVADATVTIHWPSGEADEDIDFVEGDMASFPDGTTITHTSGTLHIM